MRYRSVRDWTSKTGEGALLSPLRAALFGALVTLVATLTITTVTRPSANAANAVASSSSRSTSAPSAVGTAPTTVATTPTVGTPPSFSMTRPTTATSTTSKSTTATPPSSSTTTTVAGVVSGPVTKSAAGGGCGFSLGAQAPGSPVGTCRVLEVGDSLGNDLGWGLKRELSAASGLDLVQLDKSASGLANTSFYNWPAQLEVDLQKYHPQLVVASFGGDDEQGMTVGGSAVQFATPAWKAAYLARVKEVISEATASGAYLLWIGLPVMKPPYFNSGVAFLDSIYQQAVAQEANTTYLSTWKLFANPAGAFQSKAQVNGAWTTLRQSDGIHYSLAGENVLATYVVRKIALIYHVGLAPTNPAVITGW